MQEPGCCTDIKSHGNTEHFIFLKTISSKEKQEREKPVNMKVAELLWELCSTFVPKTV